MPRYIKAIFVEDNPDDFELILKELKAGDIEAEGPRVETADSLRTALEQGGWDVVFSDYNLPDFNAMAALGMVGLGAKDIPFIVVTGSIGEERAAELLRAGVHDFVLKERLDRLPAVVERAICDARVRRERRHALKMLEATHHELSTLVAASPLAIIVIGPNEVVRGWNPAASRLLGWQHGEVIGLPLPDLDDNDHSGFLRARTDAKLGHTFTAMESRLRRKDGTPVDVSMSMAPLGPEATDSASYLVMAEDITERKRMENLLLQSQKMEAVGLLAGGVAHDFNNILCVILGFGELLLGKIPLQDPRHRPAKEICLAAERASTLTRQLLTFSRKQTLSTKVVDINLVIHGMEEMLQRLIGENIGLRANVSRAPALVVCNPGQLEVVIMNLVINARDAMPTGGKITITTAEVEATAEGQSIVLSVSDSGEGMDAATRERIFEPFFTTKERGSGTGMGLSTVFGIVKQSGGSITVASTPGQGSTFSIHLPKALPSQAESPNAGKALPVDWRGNETILVVEDEDGLRLLISEQLRENGYSVLEAANAEAAIDQAQNYNDHIHLLLTDVILPGMSGVLLAKNLCVQRPQLLVLFMSGYTDDALLLHGVSTSDPLPIEKPFRLAVLLSRIRGALSGIP